jgi:cell division protein FtsL
MNAVVHQRVPRRPPERGPRVDRTPADAKPSLSVVDPRYRTPAQRRARARLMGVLLLVVVAAALFGLVTSHVALTQGQFRLEDMQAKAEEEQARYERLRLQVAELESPARIVAAAQERLGMVPPPGITYLSPIGPASDSAPADDLDEAAAEDWSTVKPQLASRP